MNLMKPQIQARRRYTSADSAFIFRLFAHSPLSGSRVAVYRGIVSCLAGQTIREIANNSRVCFFYAAVFPTIGRIM